MGRDAETMDILDGWLEEYNRLAQPSIPLRSAGEAGGAQLRLKYDRGNGQVAILHLVAVMRAGQPVMVGRRFDGPLPDTAVEAGLWASTQLGRRPAG
jgi:hypothetical protein